MVVFTTSIPFPHLAPIDSPFTQCWVPSSSPLWKGFSEQWMHFLKDISILGTEA
jgi:hypothetical protein